MRQSLASIVLLTLLLAACSGAPAAPQSAAVTTAVPAAMSAPTDTAIPPTDTPTAEPAAFVFPSPTPEPTPTPVPPSCAEQAAEFTAQANALLREWDDALSLAASTPRIQLAEQVEMLQALRRRAEDLAPPDCAVQIKAVLVNAMDTAISSLIDFMADPDALVRGLILLSRYDTQAVQHALTALTSYPGPLEPFTTDDVKAMLPQYVWIQRILKDGETVIETSGAPITLQVNHVNGVVYSVFAGFNTLDEGAPDFAAAWPEIQSAVLTFLPGWAEGEAWLTEFGAAEPTDALEPVVTHAGVTTVRASHVRYDGFDMESASVSVAILHKGAAGE